MQKNNLIKRYLLWFVGKDPFMTTLLLGGGGFTAGLVALIILAPQPRDWLVLGLPLGLAGVGAALGIVSWVVCRRFVSYGEGSWLYLKIRPDGVVEDSGNPMWKGWVRKGVEIRRVWLPPIDRTHSVEVTVGPFPIVLEIDFQYPFDPQEVCDVVVRGYNFDSWLAAMVNSVANGSAVVRQIRDDLDQPPAARLMDFTVALGKVLRGDKFKSRLLGNIRRPINVTVSSSAEFTID